MTWHSKESDLQPWMVRALEEAYQQRERPRCSREDFRDGFLSALVSINSKSSFLPDRWEAGE